MARPPPVSRMSIPTRSPRTAPIRLATAPRAPGRSGNQTRNTKVGTSGTVRRQCEQAVTRPLLLCRPVLLRGLPHVGDTVDVHEGVVTVHEDPQLEPAGEHELA